MADPQTLIREAQEKAERLCRLAVAQTPADYQSFITLIEQRKKVAGTWLRPIWSPSGSRISPTAGVKMARDQHSEASKRFDIQDEFPGRADQRPELLARATLTSEIYGTAVAHARGLPRLAKGVNESNPLENGETSAVAWALGMWGFGCFGTGIASADEVLAWSSGPNRGERWRRAWVGQ